MKKKYVLICLSVFLILLSLALFFIIQIKRTNLYLVGPTIVNHEVFSSYNDKGLVLKRGKKVLKLNKKKVSIKDNVDPNIIGTYKIEYNMKYYFKKFKFVRTVNVVDTVFPELTVNLDEVNREFCSKDVKQEIKYSALDNYDGNITNKVVMEEQDDKLIYSVTDSFGNTTSKEVNIIYDSKPKNKFYLNGSNPQHVVINTSYQENGASYTDGCGKSLNKDILISGNVDPFNEGEYYVTYSVDGEDDITRKVIVEKYKPKTIYLTFDDGPGANTQMILDVLDKYNVKATFFVTNQFPNYQYLIGEEHKRGHTVAVHTYSHKYADIYTTVDGYINDFNAMNEIIKNYTGSYSKFFRFAGGSSNTVSKKYSPGIVTAIAQEMTNRGYIYFDWNLSSGDAEGKTSTSKIVSNVLNRVNSCQQQCIILFHDYKATTANAMEPILSELTKRGYIFETLNENSPTAHFKIAN